MDNYIETIKDSEVNIALLVEKTAANNIIIYKELKKRKLICRLFHKQHSVDSNGHHLKFYYCCHKCYSVWSIYRKKK